MKTLTSNKNLLIKNSQKKYFGIVIIAALFLVFFVNTGISKADTTTPSPAPIPTTTTYASFSSFTLDSTSTNLNLINTTSSSFSTSTNFSTSTLPDINVINAPEIIAKNAVVYDITDNQFIYAKNANESVPMASLVKIITATVFLKLNDSRLKQGNLITKIPIIKNNTGYNAGDRDLINGEVWKVENLIRYMLITSSNIAAQSLTNTIVDDEFAFATLMNREVKGLGFNSFNFKNVSGLSIDNPDYNAKKPETAILPKQIPSAIGSAKEIALLFNSIFTNIPFLGNASIIPEAKFTNWSGNTHVTKNVNYSLFQIPNIIAGKTGTTEESGGNLIIIIKANQKKYAIVILGSTIEDRYNDTLKLASSTQAYAQAFATLK